MNIQELLNSGANVTISVGADDLKEFARVIVDHAKNRLESAIAEGRSEVYYTAEQVVGILNVDKSTLWRWNKRDFLKPIKVGGMIRYRKSDIDKILQL